MSRIIFVGSGKGGTGKTSLSVNLAFALGAMGRKVCLLDADLGLSNVDVLLGIAPEFTLEDVLFEGIPLERAMVRAGSGVDVVPGGSGVSRLADLSREARTALGKAFGKLSGYDYLLVDGSPGISSQVISLCLACPEILVVVNPDPASLTDAYALVKVLHENGLRRSPYLVVNRARSPKEARKIFERLSHAMGKYLHLGARFLGFVPHDPYLPAATARQRPLVALYPASHSGRAVLAMARELDEIDVPAGVQDATPVSFAAKALARMRESAPGRPRFSALARKALEEALLLAARLGSRDTTDPAAVSARLTSLLVSLRDGITAEDVPALPRPQGDPVRVTVISSDAAMGDILSESLGLAGFQVSPQAQAQAAVIYWRGEQESLKRRLKGLEGLGYVWVKGLTGRDAPSLGGPACVMGMPFRLDDLAGAVKRMAVARAS